MTPETFLDGRVTLWPGNCLAALPLIAADSLDSCVTDPPYGLSFMGREWDSDVPGVKYWKEVYRVLKPGAHLVSFGGSRTFGHLQLAIEQAGFETRDTIFELLSADPEVRKFISSLSDTQAHAFVRCFDLVGVGGLLAWVFGSGFPKSLDVSKAIDRAGRTEYRLGNAADISAPATEAAARWEGWGTALKPAIEPIILARKPLSESTVAANVLKWGTGALDIDDCRVEAGSADLNGGAYRGQGTQRNDGWGMQRLGGAGEFVNPQGRWPANLILDGSDEVVRGFPDTKSGEFLPHHQAKGASQIGTFNIRDRSGEAHPTYGDSGSAARFFYTAKADADDRLGSKHPTVKSLDLKQYLVRLVTPKGGTVLDCFAGTGTTGEASYREGCNAVLIEREPEYLEDIRRRMRNVLSGPAERKREGTKARHKDKPVEHGPLFGSAS